ncbi:hypothetical protein [Glaciecola sp. 1036]|uniref:hypothetical protein n=1 Tax=Alteromonadaceae TaxID=72275 RepID=UPI003D03B912
MTLLSLKLFDHCSVGSSVSIDDTGIVDSVYESTIELLPSTSTPLTEDAFVDVSSASCESLECTTGFFEIDSIAVDSSLRDIEVHDTSTPTDDSSSWGFMLNDEGGMSTFDDSHGSTDWFDGDIGISNNCDF